MMWKHAAGVALCVGPIRYVSPCSVLRTDCGKSVPLVYRSKESDEDTKEPMDVLFVKRSVNLGFMVR